MVVRSSVPFCLCSCIAFLSMLFVLQPFMSCWILWRVFLYSEFVEVVCFTAIYELLDFVRVGNIMANVVI